MKKSKTANYTSDELKSLPDESDWEGSAAMTEDEIEEAIASDPEEATLHSGWLQRATVVRPTPRFIMCVSSEGSESRLTTHKVYRVIPDSEADRLHLVRVIDDGGKEYLHPISRFVPVQIPVGAEQGFELITV